MAIEFGACFLQGAIAPLCERIEGGSDSLNICKVGRFPLVIWVNEQLDPCGILYSCIACCDEESAKECNQSFQENLTEAQKEAGWEVRMRVVDSWDDVPASALKLD
jgi:hypothetical protein